MSGNTIWDRLWHQDLANILKSDPRAIPLYADGQHQRLCQNCDGVGSMFVYVADIFLGNNPNGQHCKWLDMENVAATDPKTPRKSGWYTGTLMERPCPVCQQGQWELWLQRNCGLKGSDLRVILSDFRGLEGKQEALSVCRDLLAMNMEPGGFVTFWGDFGTGKSHLLKSLVNGFRGVGLRAKYYGLPDLLADIRERFGLKDGGVAVEDAVEQYKTIPVLCVDEVGDESRTNMTGWAQETIWRLLDARYNARDAMLTALATNVEPDRMAPEWGYLRSRMSGGRVVEVGGKDMRPLMAGRSHRAPEPVATYPVAEPEDEEQGTIDVSGAMRTLAQGMTRRDR